MGLLTGYRVVDCTIAMAGPFATQRLGDLGADVVKVEPIQGEWQRHASAGGAGKTKINASFLSLNRNKRSLGVDLKSSEGLEVVLDLVAKSDVFVQNYRNGVAERLGIDYESLKASNPNIIYVSISGYGSTGPYADLPGQDLLVQGLAGLMYSTGTSGDEPVPSGLFVADATTAYCAFEGVISALLHRERTGEGQLVEVNMLDALIAFQMQEISVSTISGRDQMRSGERHAHVHIRAPYAVFKTADDFIIVSMPPLAELADVLEEPALAAYDEERDGFSERDTIHRLTAEKLKLRTTGDWIERLQKAGIWCGPVHSFSSMLSDPQVVHNKSIIEYDHHTEGRLKTPGFPIRFEKTPTSVRFGAPLVGEHSREILGSIGYSAERIDELLRGNVISENRASEQKFDAEFTRSSTE